MKIKIEIETEVVIADDDCEAVELAQDITHVVRKALAERAARALIHGVPFGHAPGDLIRTVWEVVDDGPYRLIQE